MQSNLEFLRDAEATRQVGPAIAVHGGPGATPSSMTAGPHAHLRQRRQGRVMPCRP